MQRTVTLTKQEVTASKTFMNWQELTSPQEFNQILEQSIQEESAFVVFKHSTRCMVSKMALRSFESEFLGDIPAYFVDLIKYRELSNHIASVSGVHHQSPQVITFEKGKPVYHASHYSICAKSAAIYV